MSDMSVYIPPPDLKDEYEDIVLAARDALHSEPIAAVHHWQRETGVRLLIEHALNTEGEDLNVFTGENDILPLTVETVRLCREYARTSTLRLLLAGNPDQSLWVRKIARIPGTESRILALEDNDPFHPYFITAESAYLLTISEPLRKSDVSPDEIGMRICFNTQEYADTLRARFEEMWHRATPHISPSIRP